MTSKPARIAMHQHAFRAALSKVAAASRRLRRRREMRPRRAWLPVHAQPAHPDPVKIAVLAMESLGRASMRASFTGVGVKVAVPDDPPLQSSAPPSPKRPAPDRLTGSCASSSISR